LADYESAPAGVNFEPHGVPDVILMDIDLPGDSGISRRIRISAHHHILARPHIFASPHILTSAYPHIHTSAHFMRRSFSEGASAHLPSFSHTCAIVGL